MTSVSYPISSDTIRAIATALFSDSISIILTIYIKKPLVVGIGQRTRTPSGENALYSLLAPIYIINGIMVFKRLRIQYNKKLTIPLPNGLEIEFVIYLYYFEFLTPVF